jgi:hypothetical protein
MEEKKKIEINEKAKKREIQRIKKRKTERESVNKGFKKKKGELR